MPENYGIIFPTCDLAFYLFKNTCKMVLQITDFSTINYDFISPAKLFNNEETEKGAVTGS